VIRERASAGRFEREVRNVLLGGLVLLLFLAGAALVVMRNMTSWGIAEKLARCGAATQAIAERASLGGLSDDPQVSALLRGGGARWAAAFGPDGGRLGEARDLPDAAFAPSRLEQRPAAGASATEDSSAATPPLVVVRAASRDGRLVVAVAWDGADVAAARRSVAVLSAVVPGAAAVLVLLLIPFLRRVMRPIEALAETARGAGGVVEHTGAHTDEPERAIATFQRTIEELKLRSSQLDELRLREKERADALAVTSDTLVRSHPGGLLVFGPDGVLEAANPPALAVLDLPDLPRGRSAQEIFAKIPALAEAAGRASSGEPTLGRELRLGDEADGRLLAVTAVPVLDEAGRALGTLLFLEDRTNAARLERELSARRELAALGEMSAGIAHEFRNATATILGYARLAATTDDAAARARHLAAINSEAQHVARVTGDFLFFARPERLAPDRLDLGPLVEELLEEERMAAAGARLESRGEFGVAMADPALVRRALVNLLRNAGEAACAGGREGRVEVIGEGVSGGRARLAVEDDGDGVAPGLERKLFVPFFSTKESGTGLGLALVARIAALHGGSIEVERSPSLGGARFVLSLPAAV